MASRDLTSAFVERRTAALRKRERKKDAGTFIGSWGIVLFLSLTYTTRLGYQKLTAGGTHDLMLEDESGIQLGTLNGSTKPVWVGDVDEIERLLVDLQARMDGLKSMHAARIGSVFGKDLSDMEGRIERKTAEITDEFRTAERLLQKVGAATRRAGGDSATIGANVQRR